MKPYLVRWALFCGLFLSAGRALGAEEEPAKPSFAAVDVTTLSCKVPTRLPRDAEGLLPVEVKNPGKSWVQPLCFEVDIETTKDRPPFATHHVLQRVPAPYHGRVGRALPPGGKATYFLPRPYVGDERVRFHVKVTAASAFDRESFSVCPVRIENATSSELTLVNTCGYPVRVILRASGGDPTARLFAEDLAPNETRTVGGREHPSMDVALPPELPKVHGEFGTLQIDDWSVQQDPGTDTARLRMEAAWNASVRWQEPRRALRGELQYTLQGDLVLQNAPASRGKASIQIDPTEGIQLEARDLDSQVRSTLLEALRKAFEDLRRPDYRSWAAGRRFQLDRAGPQCCVHADLAQTGAHFHTNYRLFELEGDRWVRMRSDGVHSILESVRDLELGPGGRFHPRAIEWASVAFGVRYLQERWQFEYGAADGLPFVSHFHLQRFQGDEVGGSVELELSDVTFVEPRVRISAPSGEGVEPVRSAWESVYRTPRGRSIEGTFVLATPDRPEDWWKRPQTRGSFTFHGWQSGSPPFESAEVSIQRASAEEASGLADLFRARTSIWSNQDPSGRLPFERAFAGAVIRPHPGDPGRFDVDHPQIRQVRVQDGHIAEIAWQDGTLRRFRYAERHGETVVVETRQVFADRESSVRYAWGRLDDAVLFPEEVVIEHWFFRGFGPETYSFVARTRE